MSKPSKAPIPRRSPGVQVRVGKSAARGDTRDARDDATIIAWLQRIDQDIIKGAKRPYTQGGVTPGGDGGDGPSGPTTLPRTPNNRDRDGQTASQTRAQQAHTQSLEEGRKATRGLRTTFRDLEHQIKEMGVGATSYTRGLDGAKKGVLEFASWLQPSRWLGMLQGIKDAFAVLRTAPTGPPPPKEKKSKAAKGSKGSKKRRGPGLDWNRDPAPQGPPPPREPPTGPAGPMPPPFQPWRGMPDTFPVAAEAEKPPIVTPPPPRKRKGEVFDFAKDAKQPIITPPPSRATETIPLAKDMPFRIAENLKGPPVARPDVFRMKPQTITPSDVLRMGAFQPPVVEPPSLSPHLPFPAPPAKPARKPRAKGTLPFPTQPTPSVPKPQLQIAPTPEGTQDATADVFKMSPQAAAKVLREAKAPLSADQLAVQPTRDATDSGLPRRGTANARKGAQHGARGTVAAHDIHFQDLKQGLGGATPPPIRNPAVLEAMSAGGPPNAGTFSPAAQRAAGAAAPSFVAAAAGGSSGAGGAGGGAGGPAVAAAAAGGAVPRTIAAAAASPPLVIAAGAVAVVAAVVTAFAVLPAMLGRFSQGLLDANRRFDKSGAMATVLAGSNVQDIMRDMRSGDQLAGTAGVAAKALGELKDSLQPLVVFLGHIGNLLSALFSKIANFLINLPVFFGASMKDVLSGLNQIIENTAPKANGESMGEWLDQVARTGAARKQGMQRPFAQPGTTRTTTGPWRLGDVQP